MTDTDEESFQRAFVATSYLLGRRASELLSPLAKTSLAAVRLERRLAHPDRQHRAQALAAELSRVTASLEERRFG